MQVRINKIEYTLPMSLSDITIAQMKDVAKLWSEEAPEEAKKKLAAGDEIWSDDRESIAPVAAEIFGLLCNIAPEVLERIEPVQLEVVTDIILERVIKPVVALENIELEHNKTFTFNGETYNYPTIEYDLAGEPMPLSDTIALQGAQVTDAMIAQKDTYQYAALIVAILCLKEGEQYDLKVAKQRAVEFEQLPAQVFVEVFFCLLQLTATFGQLTQIYTLTGQLAERAVRLAEYKSTAGSTESISSGRICRLKLFWRAVCRFMNLWRR